MAIGLSMIEQLEDLRSLSTGQLKGMLGTPSPHASPVFIAMVLKEREDADKRHAGREAAAQTAQQAPTVSARLAGQQQPIPMSQAGAMAAPPRQPPMPQEAQLAMALSGATGRPPPELPTVNMERGTAGAAMREMAKALQREGTRSYAQRPAHQAFSSRERPPPVTPAGLALLLAAIQRQRSEPERAYGGFDISEDVRFPRGRSGARAAARPVSMANGTQGRTVYAQYGYPNPLRDKWGPPPSVPPLRSTAGDLSSRLPLATPSALGYLERLAAARASGGDSATYKKELDAVLDALGSGPNGATYGQGRKNWFKALGVGDGDGAVPDAPPLGPQELSVDQAASLLSPEQKRLWQRGRVANPPIPQEFQGAPGPQVDADVMDFEFGVGESRPAEVAVQEIVAPRTKGVEERVDPRDVFGRQVDAFFAGSGSPEETTKRLWDLPMEFLEGIVTEWGPHVATKEDMARRDEAAKVWAQKRDAEALKKTAEASFAGEGPPLPRADLTRDAMGGAGPGVQPWPIPYRGPLDQPLTNRAVLEALIEEAGGDARLAQQQQALRQRAFIAPDEDQMALAPRQLDSDVFGQRPIETRSLERSLAGLPSLPPPPPVGRREPPPPPIAPDEDQRALAPPPVTADQQMRAVLADITKPLREQQTARRAGETLPVGDRTRLYPGYFEPVAERKLRPGHEMELLIDSLKLRERAEGLPPGQLYSEIEQSGKLPEDFPRGGIDAQILRQANLRALLAVQDERAPGLEINEAQRQAALSRQLVEPGTLRPEEKAKLAEKKQPPVITGFTGGNPKKPASTITLKGVPVDGVTGTGVDGVSIQSELLKALAGVTTGDAKKVDVTAVADKARAAGDAMRANLEEKTRTLIEQQDASIDKIAKADKASLKKISESMTALKDFQETGRLPQKHRQALINAGLMEFAAALLDPDNPTLYGAFSAGLRGFQKIEKGKRKEYLDGLKFALTAETAQQELAMKIRNSEAVARRSLAQFQIAQQSRDETAAAAAEKRYTDATNEARRFEIMERTAATSKLSALATILNAIKPDKDARMFNMLLKGKLEEAQALAKRGDVKLLNEAFIYDEKTHQATPRMGYFIDLFASMDPAAAYRAMAGARTLGYHQRTEARAVDRIVSAKVEDLTKGWNTNADWLKIHPGKRMPRPDEWRDDKERAKLIALARAWVQRRTPGWRPSQGQRNSDPVNLR